MRFRSFSRKCNINTLVTVTVTGKVSLIFSKHPNFSTKTVQDAKGIFCVKNELDI